MSARPAVRFRIYPADGGALYYLVTLFPSKRAMYAYRRANGWRSCAPHEASTLSYDKRRRGRLLPVVGEILLHRGGVSVESLAHEALHAAAAYMRRAEPVPSFSALDADGGGDREERLATLVGYITEMLAYRLVKLGATP